MVCSELPQAHLVAIAVLLLCSALHSVSKAEQAHIVPHCARAPLDVLWESSQPSYFTVRPVLTRARLPRSPRTSSSTSTWHEQQKHTITFSFDLDLETVLVLFVASVVHARLACTQRRRSTGGWQVDVWRLAFGGGLTCRGVAHEAQRGRLIGRLTQRHPTLASDWRDSGR